MKFENIELRPSKKEEVAQAVSLIYSSGPSSFEYVFKNDKDMLLKQPENENQTNDWHTWCPNVKVGAVIDSPINPVLFES